MKGNFLRSSGSTLNDDCLMKYVWTLCLFVAFVAVGCQPTGGEQATDTAEQSEPPLQEPVRSPASVDQEAAFEAFWADFSSAALAGDREQVTEMVRFPFKDRYREVNDPEHEFYAANAGDFLRVYDQVITEEVLAAIREKAYQAAPMLGKEIGNGVGEGDYVLTTASGVGDLVFEWGQNSYRLTSTAYYP